MSLSRHFIYFFAVFTLSYNFNLLYAQKTTDTKKDAPSKSDTSTTTSSTTTTSSSKATSTIKKSSSKDKAKAQSTTTTSSTTSTIKNPSSKDKTKAQSTTTTSSTTSAIEKSSSEDKTKAQSTTTTSSTTSTIKNPSSKDKTKAQSTTTTSSTTSAIEKSSSEDKTKVQSTTTTTQSPQPKTSLSPMEKNKRHIQRKIDKLHERLKNTPNNFNLHFLLGKYYYLLGDFDKAIFHLKKNNTNPSTKTLILLAKIFSQKEDYKEEIRILSMLLEIHPDSAKVHTDIATAYYKNKEIETAIEHYKIALQKNPRYKGAYKGLWTVFEAQGNFYDMRQIVVDFLTISPRDIEAHSKLCQANLKSRFADESISSCNQAIKINPSYPNNHVYLGLAHKWNGNDKQAEKIIFDTAKKFRRSLLAQYEAGMLAEEKNLWRSALTFYRNCVKNDSRSLMCIMKTAHLEVQLEQYEEATQSFLSACKINKFTTFPKIRDAAGKMRTEKKMEKYYHFKKVAERCHIVGGRRLEKAPYEPLDDLIVEEAPPELFEETTDAKKKGAKKKSSKKTKKKATKTKKQN